MGRLFWKIFIGFWLTIVLAGAGAGVAVYVHNRINQPDIPDLATGHRAEFLVGIIANTLEYGGPQGVQALIEKWPGIHRPDVLVVDPSGQDMLGRKVPPQALSSARAMQQHSGNTPNQRLVTARNGTLYLVFVPGSFPVEPGPPPLHENINIQIAIALLASLLFSAGFAWYLTRPVRHLRRASHQLAEGCFDVRVTPLMGSRRDDIADLGKDFDYMAARLQALVGAQKQLLHDVSHELRSPLARLRLAIGLAQQSPDKLETATQRIEREVERLDELLGEILTLSRLEAGFSDMGKEALELTGILEEVAQDARFEAQASQRDVVLKPHGDIAAHGNAELLHRAFENVVRNAIRHTAENTTVEIAAQPSADGRWIVVDIRDHGPGVPANELESIFTPFYRSENASSSTRGYGLGLAIAKQAIEAHGGTISAKNRESGGLRVEIRLPLAR